MVYTEPINCIIKRKLTVPSIFLQYLKIDRIIYNLKIHFIKNREIFIFSIFLKYQIDFGVLARNILLELE